MENEKIQVMIENIELMESTYAEKQSKTLQLDLLKRIVIRLNSFSSDCQDCHRTLEEINDHLSQINPKSDDINKDVYHKHKALLKQSTEHLKTEHKLVPDNHYTGEYMTMGIGLGLIYGVVFISIFDVAMGLAIGLPIGLSIGLSIGVAKDAEAKKNDRVI